MKNFTSPKIEGKSYPVLEFAYNESLNLPAAFDWRDKGAITPVYSQGQCGSCWAFSVTENVESMWAIQNGKLNNLAMQQLVDCDIGNGDHGCDGGNPPYAFNYIMRVGGLDSLSAYSYTGRNGQCRFNTNAIAAKVKNWGYVTQNDNENAMGQYVYSSGPPSACVDARAWQFYKGGPVTSGCGRMLDHCVQITGWQTLGGVNVWNVRNSWGTNWGDQGFIYLARGNNMCAIGTEVTSCSTK